MGGERGGAPPSGFDCGNSRPSTHPSASGAHGVFTTTNGTRALALDGRAGRVGGFVNAAAVTAGWPPSRATSSWCAPGSGRFCLEDAVCAGLLVSRLAAVDGALTDAARAARALWDRYAGDLHAMLADAAWAQALVAQGGGPTCPSAWPSTSTTWCRCFATAPWWQTA